MIELLAIVPATFELRATVNFDRQPFAQYSYWDGNCYARVEPELWFCAGPGELTQYKPPHKAETHLSLAFDGGVLEEVDFEALVGGVWAFRAVSVGHPLTIDDLGEEVVYAVPLGFGIYPAYTDYGPVLVQDFASDSHTVLYIGRLDNSYNIVLRSVERPWDTDRDGERTGNDVEHFISEPWDWNVDGTLNSQDFFDFLTAYWSV